MLQFDGAKKWWLLVGSGDLKVTIIVMSFLLQAGVIGHLKRDQGL